jgi:hypothetical protein
VCFAGEAFAQYNPSAGKNAPMDKVERQVRAMDGTFHSETVEQRPDSDRFGNAVGNTHDLAIDGAFEGQTVAVIQLYTIDFDFHLPKAALKEKGFSTYRWINKPPSPEELEKGLEKASQLWLISGETRQLTPEHLKVIKKFWEAGHGVYIWGDNQPYYADANYVAEALFGTTMLGDVPGAQVVGVQKAAGMPGLMPNHLLTTGLENIYEGITIATIQSSKTLTPLIYGSAGNLVAAYYDHDGRRAILDGGFTRLYMGWDTAGTPRYVKNAAAWLVNAERFGDAVINPAIKKSTMKPVTVVPSMTEGPSVTAPSVTVAPAPAAPTSGFLSLKLLALLLGGMISCFLLLYIVPNRE